MSTAVRLENWSVCVREDPYCPPELLTQHLQGEAYGHPRFPDGERVTTTPIVRVSPEGIVATASGSRYQLGAVNPDYEAQYPNALNRVRLNAPAQGHS